ncbi:hypothetical protein Tco_1052656 [Tanacetum coccineum]
MWGMFYGENFVRIGEDYQEYGLAIPDVMLNDAIKQSESYQMFIKYSTESEPEPKHVKKNTASRRVVKKKVTISADDNIIPDPDVALELGKSISLSKAEEEEAVKQVHATHARIVTEYVPKSSKKNTSSRSSRSVVIQDTPSAPKPKPATSKPKLKGVQSLTPAKKEAADIMQALKESKKTSKRQPGTGGSSEGTGTILGVPDKSIVVSATLNERTDTKPGVLNVEKVITEEKIILKGDDEVAEIESDEDEIYKYKIRVRKDEDVEMINAKVEDSEKGDAKKSDMAQADVEKTEEIKDAAKKAELPPTSSSLSVSSGFGDQFLKLSFDNSLVSTIKDNTDAEINSLLEVKIQYKVPHIQSPSVLRVPVFVISEPTVLTPVQETSLAAPVTTLPLPSVSTTPHVPQQTTTLILTPPIITETPTITTVVLESDTLTAVQLRVAKLEKDVSELKNINHSAETIATLKSQVPMVVDDYLGSKLGDALQKALQKHSKDLIQKHSVKPALESSKIQSLTINLKQGFEKSGSKILKIKREQAEKQKMSKYTIKSTDKATLKEYDQKSALYQTEQPKCKKTRIRELQTQSKTIKESMMMMTMMMKTLQLDQTREPVEEPIAEVVMDDAVNTAGKDVVRDDDQPQDTSKPKTNKTPNPKWFKQPPRPPTPDPK